MSTLADILIPLAGSISNERAIKMREACDALEAKIDIAQRGTNHALDLISLLTDRVKELERDNLDRRLTKLESAVDVLDRQRVETLKLRVNGLESMVLELKDATKNIALHTDETLRAVRGGGCTCTHEKRLHANATDGCLVSGCRCETYTGEGRAEEALSGNGRDQERAQPVRAAPPGAQALDVAGEGREPSRQAAPSPAPSVPAPVCEVCGDTDPMFRLGGVWRCSECHREHHDKMRAKAPNSITLPILDVKRLYGIDTDVPAPATGEVPKWVPSPRELVLAHYQGIKENLDAEHVWDHVRRLIASRAPAAPVVDVNALLTRFYSELDVCDLESKAMTRALAAQGVKCKEVQP